MWLYGALINCSTLISYIKTLRNVHPGMLYNFNEVI